MMGIFYRAPSPSSPPFCKEGDQVKAGQVLCMIEAMKVFNEIKAEFPCTVERFLLDELFHGTNSHDRRIGAEAKTTTPLDSWLDVLFGPAPGG